MVIGIDVSRANRIQKTGIEWYAYHLLNELKKITDQKDRYVLYTDETLRDALRELPASWNEQILSWPPKKFWTQGRLSWEMLRRRPNLLFIPSHVIPVLHPKRVVLTCHDIGFEYRPELYPKAERAYHRWSMRFGVRAASHIITVSHFTKEQLIDRYKLPEEKIHVIYHGVDHDIFFPKKDVQETHALFQTYHLPHGKPYLLYCGRLEKKKNVETLLHAFKRWKTLDPSIPYILLLIGRRGYGYSSIQSLLQRLNLSSSVFELGWVSQEDMPVFMRNAWATVLPSWYEGFGLPVIESMASGVPTIASSIPALREIAQDASLFFNPKDYRELVQCFQSLVQEKQLYSSLHKRGLEHSKRFTWGSAARETYAVLEHALSETERA